MTSADILRRHFRLRAWQRFGLVLPAARIARIERALVRCRDLGLGRPSPTGRLLFVVLCDGARMRVAFDPALSALVTAMIEPKPHSNREPPDAC